MNLNYYISLAIAYLLGCFTFIPLVLLFLYFSNNKKKESRTATSSDALEEEKEETNSQQYFYKVGWLHITRDQQPISRSTSIGGIVKSYLSGNNNNTKEVKTNQDDVPTGDNSNNNSFTTTYFAALKFNTLYLYDSELQLDCTAIINISDYSIHIYPHGLKDYELFSKVNRIQLKKKKSFLLDRIEKDYYINCSRCVDKEDWYIAFKRASKLHHHGEPPSSKDLQSCMENSTHFDQDAMNHLISTIHSDPGQFELQWLNALLGRIFLGIYKTETTKSFFYNKILSKIAKLNARRPPFLEEITVRSVDGGHGPPYITQPRLIHLSPQGEYTGDCHLFYDGHFRVELETVLRCKYSERLPPIRIDLVLAITLKSIEGKLMFKIKEPPTNRAWMGFYKKPKMEWIVEPLVWEKRMGYSMVSKAIQSKIEEIFSETMVLPNMDDIVFFQTEGVGGIYGKETNYGKSTTSAFDLDSNKKKSSTADNNPTTSNMSNISYQSLPELYSAPSELVVTADPIPLLSTSVSSTAAAPTKKSWFRRNNKSTSEHEFDDVHTTPVVDTPSQQTLKLVITPKDDDRNNSKTEKKIKRKKSTNTNNRAQFLATNVDHSIQSLLLNTKPTLPSVETPTVQPSSPTPCHPPNTEGTPDLNATPGADALRSVRLSKKMLLLVDQPSRMRSKSLPSTGLSIDVAQMGSKEN
ncbi:putative integral membrane protein conserved region-domain-containing protein [Helicostylum pulchrum]|nr:putative integral membrane protein conserved region-domain-containing protein [Helicostylum pulchrum]